MNSTQYAAKNTIKIPTPYLIQVVYFGLVFGASSGFLLYFLFTRFDLFQRLVDSFEVPDLLRDPNFSYLLFFDLVRFSVFSFGALYFLSKLLQKIYILANENSANSFVGVPGPIYNFFVVINDLFIESRIFKPTSNLPIKKGMLPNLIFGNWADWLSPKYWPILFFFISWGKALLNLLFFVSSLFCFFLLASFSLRYLQANPEFLRKNQIDPFVLKVLGFIGEFSFHSNGFFTFEPVFYFLALLSLYCLVISTQSIFVKMCTNNIKQNFANSGHPLHFYSFIKLNLDKFKINDFPNKLIKDTPPNVGVFTKDTTKEFTTQLIFETQPLPLSSNRPHRHLPFLCIFLSFLFYMVFLALLTFAPSFQKIPDSFYIFYQSFLVILFPKFSFILYNFFVMYFYNIIFQSDIVSIKITGTLVGSSVSFDAGNKGGFSSGGLSVRSTSFVDISYARVLTESMCFYNLFSFTNLSDILGSPRHIINTVPAPDLEEHVNALINDLSNYKDTSIDLPGVNTSDENASRMAYANAYNALLSKGEFTKAAQLAELLQNKKDQTFLDEKKST